MKLMNTIPEPVQVRYGEEYTTCQHRFHSHLYHEIYYFNGGICKYLIGDRLYELVPGDLILMHGMTLHSPHVSPEQLYRRTIVHFDADFAQSLAGPSFGIQLLQPFKELRNHRLRLIGQEREEVEQILQRMVRMSQSEEALSVRRLHTAFLELLVMIHAFCEKPMEELNESASDKSIHVQNMISFLEQHYMEDLHLEQLEESLHLSKYYLSKIFKEVTGVTIFNYLYQRRINQAKVLLLLEKRLSVTDIGYITGFKHPSHFSRMFKSMVGRTPENYRKNSFYE